MKTELTAIVYSAIIHLICVSKLVDSSITVYDDKNRTITSMDDLSATFGPSLPEKGFEGYIAVAKPISACTAIESPPPNVTYVNPKKWIALIQRTPSASGNCSFDLKVYNAQKAGYSAVIIFNSETDNLIRMSSSGKYSIQIPSVFIGNSNGREIARYYTYENKTYVIINNDDSDLNYLMVPFVCVVSICFIVAVVIFVVKFAMHCHKVRKNRFPRSALKKIPTKKYQKTDKYDTCPICLNEYEEGVKIRILPCEHAYHIECIDKWLLRNNRFCPVCKRRVLPGGQDSDSEENSENTTTSTTNARQNVVENEPNEDDDTNESSRLLVTTRANSNEDSNSVLTNATLNTAISNLMNGSNATNSNINLNAANNELSSLNNQMTTSVSSQLQNSSQQQKDQLRTSSSRYGSISSVNMIYNQLNSDSNNAIKMNNEYETYGDGTQQAASGELNPNEAENEEETYDNVNSKSATKLKNNVILVKNKYASSQPSQGQAQSQQSSQSELKETPDFHTPNSITSENSSFGVSSSPFTLNNYDKELQLKIISKNSNKKVKKNNSNKSNKVKPSANTATKSNKISKNSINPQNISKIVSKLENSKKETAGKNESSDVGLESTKEDNKLQMEQDSAAEMPSSSLTVTNVNETNSTKSYLAIDNKNFVYDNNDEQKEDDKSDTDGEDDDNNFKSV